MTKTKMTEKVEHLFKALSIPNSRHKWKIFYGRAYDLSILELEEALAIRKEELRRRQDIYAAAGLTKIVELIDIDRDSAVKALLKIIANKRKS